MPFSGLDEPLWKKRALMRRIEWLRMHGLTRKMSLEKCKGGIILQLMCDCDSPRVDIISEKNLKRLESGLIR